MATFKFLPNAYNSEVGTTWTTTTVDNIDNTVAGADGTFIVAGGNSDSTIYYDILPTPSSWGAISALNYNIRYKLEGNDNDTEVLYIRVLKSDLTTALTNEMTVATYNAATPNQTLTNSGEVSFTGLDTSATQADWDGAVIAIRTDHTANMGNSGCIWSIDEVELNATYNSAPTITGNTATGTTFGATDDVVLEFTGEDAELSGLTYEVNIYSVVNEVLDSSTDWDSSFELSSEATDNDGVAQSFQSQGGYLESVTFYGNSIGTPTGTLTAKLYAHSGTFGSSSVPTGTALATSDSITVNSSTSNPTFTFTGTPYTMTSGTSYVLAFESTIPETTGTDAFQFPTDSLFNSLAGNMSTWNGSTWTSFGAYDLNYVLYYSKVELSGSSSTDSTFANTVTTGDTAPFNSGEKVSLTLSAGTLPINDTYYWEARASDGVSWSDWTAKRDFTINANVAPTITATTSGGTSFVSTPPVLEFTGNDVDNEDLGYGFEIFTDSGSTIFETTNKTTSTHSFGENQTYQKIAQSFIGSGSTLDTALVWLRRINSPTGTIYAELYAATGTAGTDAVPTGSVLATSDSINAVDLTTSTTPYTFTFGTPYTVAAGTAYVIAFVGPSGTSSNYARIDKDFDYPYDGVNPSYYGAGSWTSLNDTNTFYIELNHLKADFIIQTDSSGDTQFKNTVTTGDTHPFTKNEKISYTYTATTLTAGTYYWDARVYDEAGQYSDWTTPRSFDYTATATAGSAIKISGNWKEIAGAQINIGGTWKTVTAMKINIGGVWKDITI